MGLLDKSTVYLVGPIEYDPNGEGWRDKITIELNKIGVTCLDPYKKPFINSIEESSELFKHWKDKLKEGEFSEVEAFAKKIRSEDLRMVDYATFIVAYINPKIPTFGSVEELSWACRCMKPTFIVIEGGKENCPLWLLGMFHHEYIYSSFDEVLDILNKINSEEIKADSKRWKILKYEYR